MGAMKNANKRRAKRQAASGLRLGSEIHRARLAREQRVQVQNMRVPGGYYAMPFPDEIERDQTAYLDSTGKRVDVTPENAGTVSRFAADRPKRQHSTMMPVSNLGTVVTAPTGDELRKARDLKAMKVYRVNATTPPRKSKSYTGPKVREWAVGA